MSYALMRIAWATAHAIRISAVHMLSRYEQCHELGPNYVDEQRRDHLVDW